MTRYTMLSLALLAFFSISASAPPSLSKADSLFEKDRYEEALKEYLGVLAQAKGDVKYTALYRAAESEALLFRYGEAAQRVFTEPAPSSPLWQVRWHILKAEMSRLFLRQYGHAAPKDREEGKKDLTRRTKKEWHAEIAKAYQALWAYRDLAKATPLTRETYFIETAKTDLEKIPTLWDFVVHRWSDYLLGDVDTDEDASKPQATALLVERFKGSIETNTPVLKAAALFEEASEGGGAMRAAARELWKLSRLRLATHESGLVETPADTEAFRNAAIQRLTSTLKGFRSARAQSEIVADTAYLYQRGEQYKEAVEMCARVAKEWPKTHAASRCHGIRSQILMPSLTVRSHPVLPGAGGGLKITAKNLDTIYFRLYPTKAEELQQLSASRSGDSWRGVRWITDESVRQFLQRKPIEEWKTALSYPKPHVFINKQVSETPKLKKGLYVAMASSDSEFAAGKALVQGVILNVTDLVVFASTGLSEDPGVVAPATERKAKGFHVYLSNAVQGTPVEKGLVDAYWSRDSRSVERVDEVTDARGIARFDAHYGKNGPSNGLDILASKDEAVAYLPTSLYFSQHFPARLNIFVETDRPIYRPGQELKLKVTVLRRLNAGYEVHRGKSKLALSLRDAGGQTFHDAKLELNEFGSTKAQVKIPSGRLLGSYSIQASVKDGADSFYGSTAFTVEEYKRPEFELTLAEAKDAWKYSKSATVKGKAKYYFGGSVPKAHVKYKVYRETFRPWFCWWWSPRFFDDTRREVAQGETITDASGEFQLSFEPKPGKTITGFYEKTPLPSRFIVEVEARDAGGRTLQAQKAYFAAAQAHLFDLQFPEAFLDSRKTTALTVRAVNYNEKAIAAEARFEIYRLEKRPSYEEFEEGSEGVESRRSQPDLQTLFEKTPSGPRVATGSFKTSGTEPKGELPIPALATGVYRLVVKGPDAWGQTIEQSVVFLTVDKASSRVELPLPIVSLAETSSVISGNTTLALIGSSDLKGKLFVETWKGNVLENTELLDGGVHLKKVSIENRHKGGVTLRWFGVTDLKIRNGEVHVDVPWKDKEAKVSLNLNKTAAPGEKVNWELSARDLAGKAIDGEATLRVYDRSLEYYAAKRGEWGDGLYGPAPHPSSVQESWFQLNGSAIYVDAGILEKLIGLEDRPQQPAHLTEPRLRSQASQLRYGRSRYGHMAFESEGGSMRMMAPPLTGVPAKSRDSSPRPGPQQELTRLKENSTEEAAPPRSQFADTAHFDPQLRLKNGKARVSFLFPEQLTGWRVVASVLTKDVRFGAVTEEVVTKKDFMVRAEIPRFFREQDTGAIKAVLHNETDRKISGKVTLAVTDTEKKPVQNWGLKSLEKTFSIEPHGTTAIRWDTAVPSGTGEYKVRLLASAGNLKDAEERDLPVLPSRQRLITSQVVALDGNQTKELRLPRMSGTDVVEQTTLQIDPQILLPILNSLPLLVRYPYENTESVLNHYVPLAIMNQLYTQQPSIRAAVKAIPKRKTVTPAWDRTDPRRLMTLMETPWEGASQGRETHGEIVDLFEPSAVEREKATSLSKLSAFQLASGGFPWCPGGHEDPYMTLYVLAGFQEASQFDVPIPEALVKKAFQYVLREMTSRLKPDTHNVSLLLYASYVMSYYVENYDWAKSGQPLVKSWVDFSDKHSRAMTVLGKAYAAHTYHRLNETAKAQSYLDRALDGSREDDIVGVYWTPEKLSWLWYNDTTETHAFLLRTLVKFRPADERVAGVAKWLLFHRKGNEWGSTKASAAAIYSLIDFMKTRGALEKPDTYHVSWDTTEEDVSLSPTDWLAKPLRWIKEGSSDRKPATIGKKGPGIAYASLTTIFASDNPPAPPQGNLLNVERKIFLRVKDGQDYRLKPLKRGDRVKVGDALEVQLHLTARSQFEYVHLKSPKGAGFEAETLTSGWKWENLSRYEEPRDSLSNFFLPWIPHGEYVLSYRLRASTPGTYKFGPAVAQSQYAPEMANYSEGFEVNIIE